VIGGGGAERAGRLSQSRDWKSVAGRLESKNEKRATWTCRREYDSSTLPQKEEKEKQKEKKEEHEEEEEEGEREKDPTRWIHVQIASDAGLIVPIDWSAGLVTDWGRNGLHYGLGDVKWRRKKKKKKEEEERKKERKRENRCLEYIREDSQNRCRGSVSCDKREELDSL
jgi:hypothetical protein